MRLILIPAVTVILLTGCNKKTEPSEVSPTAAPASNSVPTAAGLAAWGSSKADILTELKKVKAKIISDAGDLLVAEVGPAGLTGSDGKPVNTPLRLEYQFKDGKLAQMKTGF